MKTITETSFMPITNRLPLASFMTLAVIAGTCGLPIGDRSAAAASQNDSDLQANRIVCGPRCLQYLMQHYGVDADTDLIAIIRKVQWPSIESGVSIGKLSGFLHSQGIHTRVVRARHREPVRLSAPAIVHLRNDGAVAGPDGTPPLDHFAVQLPGSPSGMVELWDGLEGVVELTTEEFQSRWSGIIVLTSTEPIDTATMAAPRGSGTAVAMLLLAGTVMFVIALLRGRFVWHRRCRLRSAGTVH